MQQSWFINGEKQRMTCISVVIFLGLQSGGTLRVNSETPALQRMSLYTFTGGIDSFAFKNNPSIDLLIFYFFFN